MTHYIGTELELFASATNWKRYWQSKVNAYIRGKVLEVGAGIGTNALALINIPREKWVCLEPDQNLAREIANTLEQYTNEERVTVKTGTVDSIDENDRYDTILYIDVLEHIEKDGEEISKANARLASGGHLIILSPAHQFLFSEFDVQVGHFRRYSRKSLDDLIPEDLEVVQLCYLDAVGTFASLANKALLRRGEPSSQQLQIWDKWMVPFSRVIDPLFFYRFGKSVLGIFRKSSNL